MLATYDLLTALHTSCASETLPTGPTHPTGGGGKVEHTSIMYMLATCRVDPIQSLLHCYIQRTYRTMNMRGEGGCWAGPYINDNIYIYTHAHL